jgi:hypothetical protein
VPYECTCDYSYTCDACLRIRLEFQWREYQEELREWTVDAIRKIADTLNIHLDAPPKKPSRYG